jgi:hypothetical protein
VLCLTTIYGNSRACSRGNSLATDNPKSDINRHVIEDRNHTPYQVMSVPESTISGSA